MHVKAVPLYVAAILHVCSQAVHCALRQNAPVKHANMDAVEGG